MSVGTFLAGLIIGAGVVIVVQLATKGNEEKQAKRFIKKMKKASLKEKEGLKRVAKRWIDKL